MINQTFTGITPEHWEKIKEVFNAQARPDVPIASDSGAGKTHGIEFTWAYGGQALAVVIVHVPWIVARMGHNEQDIMQQFTEWINQANT